MKDLLIMTIKLLCIQIIKFLIVITDLEAKQNLQTKQQIRLLNPRAKSYGTPQIKPVELEPQNIKSLEI